MQAMIEEQITSITKSRSYGGRSLVCRPASGIRCLPSAAFTLIEVLVAMTVLAVMVLMAANIFQSSSASWNIGTQKADMNTAARAALDFMARELASAVAGPIEKPVSEGADYMQFRQESPSDLRFLALANEPNASGNERAIRGVFFYLDPTEYSLRAGQKVKTAIPPTPPTLDCYFSTSPTWHNSREGNLLITNVWELNFYVYTNETDLRNGNYIITPPQKTLSELPLCVDIGLVMLSDDDMKRTLALNGDVSAQTNFVARNSKLYSTRVYFPNRKGYGGR